MEQHVWEVAFELAATNIKVEELKLNSNTMLILGGQCLVVGYFYIKIREEEDGSSPPFPSGDGGQYCNSVLVQTGQSKLRK